MLYIAICEDETSQLAVIEDKVRMYLKNNHILAELKAYGRSDLLKYDLQEGKYFDIILSDIEMPGTDIPKSSLDEKLPEALGIAIKRIRSQSDQSYLIQTAARIEKIPLKQIVYIQKDGKNAMIICTDGSVKSVRKSLADVYKELHSEDFVFVERGSIVNIAQIKSIQKEEVLLSNGVRIHASRPRLEEMKERMAAYWSERI